MASIPTVDIETLLSHQEWLRRLAFSLVRNEDAADELVQATWEVAITNPPKRGGSIRGWFRSVAANILRDRARKSTNRRRRELATATQEGDWSTSEATARAELQHLLAEKLFSLDEKYQVPLVLRYFEDLPPREIAERLQLSGSVVRKRLQRGLEALRVRLGEKYGDDWRSYCNFILALGLGLPKPKSFGKPASTKSFLLVAIIVSAATLFVALQPTLSQWREVRGSELPEPANSIQPADSPIIDADSRLENALPWKVKEWSPTNAKDPRVIRKIEALVPDTGFGFSVSGIQDVDGDGIHDLLICEWMDSTVAKSAGAVHVISGNADAQDKRIWSPRGTRFMQNFGYDVDDAGDVDLDGVPDFIVGSFAETLSKTESGTARVYSGKTGEPIHEWSGEEAFDHFGVSVDGVGDVNMDGHADLLVGAWQSSANGKRPGLAYLYSGRNGELLKRWTGETVGCHFGFSASRAGDVDGDGFPDLIVGAFDGNYVSVYSGRDWNEIHRFSGNLGDEFGFSVSAAGDVNRDGFDDVLIGARKGGANGAGYVDLYSGADGARIYRFRGERGGSQFGRCVDTAGDMDKDGVVDIVVGAPSDSLYGENSGFVRVFSGQDGRILFTVREGVAYRLFGHWVSAAGDLNQDGHDDLIVGAPGGGPNGVMPGAVQLISGDLFLKADTARVRAKKGGSVRFDIDFPDSEAESKYLLLASGTQRSPVTISGIEIPLGMDPLLEESIAFNPLRGTTHAFGELDDDGNATVYLSIPPTISRIAVPRALYFAAISFEPDTYELRMSTGAVSVSVVP